MMDADQSGDARVAEVAAAIGEPARAAMLFCLMDGCARTSTELSLVADVSPSTASAHLNRLRGSGLVSVLPQGKHRYYRIAGAEVAAALESLRVVAGAHAPFKPNTPSRLRAARSCYDHLAGRVGVLLHDRLHAAGWLEPVDGDGGAYALTEQGEAGLRALGLDPEPLKAQRRRFAYGCLDWSERRPHLGGALGSALLAHALARGWLERDLDSRALTLTEVGRRALESRLGVSFQADGQGAAYGLAL